MSQVASEWDALAPRRAEQLHDEVDISFFYILVPTIERLMTHFDRTNVLDIGCGTGELTVKMAAKCSNISGIDISPVSIELARRSAAAVSNVAFYVSSAPSLASTGVTFTAAYANMSLMDMPDFERDIEAVSKMLRPGSLFVATITHPFFWPVYWNYASEPWFFYNEELAIRARFEITKDRDGRLQTTHFHRPLAMYFDAFRAAGFFIDAFLEPEPPKAVPTEYMSKWRFPRFAAFRCVKT